MKTELLNRQTCKTGIGRVSEPSININKSGKICINAPAVDMLNAEFVQLIYQNNKLYIFKSIEHAGFRLRSDKNKRTYKVFNSKGLVKRLSKLMGLGDKTTIASATLAINENLEIISPLDKDIKALEVDIKSPIRLKTQFDPS